jgi:hypothetical protein
MIEFDPVVQVEQPRYARFIPMVLLGSAAVLAAAAASEQIASKVTEFRQAGVLMKAGQTPVAGFSQPHTVLTAAEHAKVTDYQAAIDSHHHDRDRDWTLALKLTEAAVICEAARRIARRQEAGIPTAP